MRTRFFGHSSGAGFSLVELLIVTTLLPLLAFTIYANLNSGIQIWQRFQPDDSRENIEIFFYKLSKDLLQTFSYSGIAFEGDKQHLSFASAIRVHPKLGGDDGIGEVKYFYDAGKKAVLKEERDISLLFKEHAGTAKIELSGVRALLLSYFRQDPMTKKYVWVETWDPGEKTLPIAVKILLQIGPAGTKLEKVERTLYLPAGG